MKKIFLSVALLSCLQFVSVAQVHRFEIDTRNPGARVRNTMYGIFFEDINFGGDGGLYGELVKNRSFEFSQPLSCWKEFGNVVVKDDGPFDRCPHYVMLMPSNHIRRPSGIQNEGYFGIGILGREPYRFTVWAKAPQGKARIRVQLIDESPLTFQQEFAEDTIDIHGDDWKKYECVLQADQTHPDGRLRVFMDGQEPVCLEHVSLFPVHTFRDRPNGLRADVAEALSELHPGVLRFPGGCVVEGMTLDSRYKWKDSVGPVENRPTKESFWQWIGRYHRFGDYYQSYGMGFYEFFLFAEDIGAEPVPAVNVGMACQAQNLDPKDVNAFAPLDSLQSYIDDCLDLIEFANGDTSTVWGGLRARMGHHEPFHLKYIELGNEQSGTLYFERVKLFIDAIRARYPDIMLIGAAAVNPSGKRFETTKEALTEMHVDIIDEHSYSTPQWYLESAARYDSYDRKGPLVFLGEYACRTPERWNHYQASLCEAAFMTGLERNADIVAMATYSPTLAHVKGWQSRPNLLWFDNISLFRPCSYWVQYLYSNHSGTSVLPLLMDGKPVAGGDGQDGLFASCVLDDLKGEVIVKVANTGEVQQQIVMNLGGLKHAEGVITHTLCSPDMDAENSFEAPELIVPVQGSMNVKPVRGGSLLEDMLQAKSFRVYRIKGR